MSDSQPFAMDIYFSPSVIGCYKKSEIRMIKGVMRSSAKTSAETSSTKTKTTTTTTTTISKDSRQKFRLTLRDNQNYVGGYARE